MTCSDYSYSNHAVVQMFKRGISADDIEEGIKKGEKIKYYPQDKPYPSCLVLSFVKQIPLHIVVSQDAISGICFIITAYIPDPAYWDSDFKNKI